MNSLRMNLPSLRTLPRAQRHLLVTAAIIAVSLLSVYVNLLHEAVARGTELQRTFASRVPTKSSAYSQGATRGRSVMLAADASELK